jgi:hypothetical protein
MTGSDGKQLNFEIIGACKPSVNGKDAYQRLLIKRIPPKEKVVPIYELLCGSGGSECEKCESCEVEIVELPPSRTA